LRRAEEKWREWHWDGANRTISAAAASPAIPIGVLSETSPTNESYSMKICPIAVAVGCVKCPIFKMCPVKSVIGDYVPPTKKAAAKSSATKNSKVSKNKK